MKSSILKSILTILKVLAVLASGYYVALFLYISISRMTFPLTLEWVEGAVLVQANRILLGQKLYPEPSAAYIPLVYQPLYLYLTTAFIKIFGLNLMAPRLLSILSSCGCIVMIFLITQKIAGTRLSGLISAGFFAATNGIVWTWFDFARVDMLCIFFFLAGFYFLLWDGYRSAMLAGILCALSFFTKQTTAPIILLIFGYYFWVNRKSALVFILTFGLLTGIGTFLLNYESTGLYIFYIYKVASYHRLDLSAKNIGYALKNVLQPVLIVFGLITLSIFANLKKILKNPQDCLLLMTTLVTLAVSIWGALIAGSTRNAFIPAYAMLAVMFGVALQYLHENSEKLLQGNFRLVGSIVLIGVVVLQFSFLQYDAQKYIPTAQDVKRGNGIIDILKNTDGEFLIPTQNYLALLVHKKTYYHDATLGEFNGEFGKSLPQWTKIKREIVNIVRSKEVNFVYMDKPRETWLGMTCIQSRALKSNSKFIPTLYQMTCH